MMLNLTNCMYMDVSFMKGPQVLPPLRLCDQNLQSAEVVKILGIKVAKDLMWATHIGDVLGRASGRLFMLTRLERFGLSVEDLVTIYVGFVRPLLEYAVPVWHPGLTEIETTPGIGAYSEEGVQNHLGWWLQFLPWCPLLITCNLSDLRSRRNKICSDFATNFMSLKYFAAGYLSWDPK